MEFASVGVDGWAVDYVRLILRMAMLSLRYPFLLPDERTQTPRKGPPKLSLPSRPLCMTGIQLLGLNTIYQLLRR